MSAATTSTAMTPGKLSPLGSRSPEVFIAVASGSGSGEGVLSGDAVDAAGSMWTAGANGSAPAAAVSVSVVTAARQTAAARQAN
ncbi:MAG: hypothetical protein NTX16_10395, partial [Actinobacteria bacterium]|nr:hypothetical protein [Actinomycetota bacterium]